MRLDKVVTVEHRNLVDLSMKLVFSEVAFATLCFSQADGERRVEVQPGTSKLYRTPNRSQTMAVARSVVKTAEKQFLGCTIPLERRAPFIVLARWRRACAIAGSFR